MALSTTVSQRKMIRRKAPRGFLKRIFKRQKPHLRLETSSDLLAAEAPVPPALARADPAVLKLAPRLEPLGAPSAGETGPLQGSTLPKGWELSRGGREHPEDALSSPAHTPNKKPAPSCLAPDDSVAPAASGRSETEEFLLASGRQTGDRRPPDPPRELQLFTWVPAAASGVSGAQHRAHCPGGCEPECGDECECPPGLPGSWAAGRPPSRSWQRSQRNGHQNFEESVLLGSEE
nr:PREDICTED: uncharacterized protein LOC106700755 [Bos mutus]